jgi:hypothetical protein
LDGALKGSALASIPFSSHQSNPKAENVKTLIQFGSKTEIRHQMATLGTSLTYAQHLQGETENLISVSARQEGSRSYRNIFIDKDASLSTLAKNVIVPDRQIKAISTYGIQYPGTAKMIDIITKQSSTTTTTTNSSTITTSSTTTTTYPTTTTNITNSPVFFIDYDSPSGIDDRATAVATQNNKRVRVINRIIGQVWAQYSHNTCGLLSYVLKKLQEGKVPGDSVTLEEEEHFLGRVLQGVDVIDSPNKAFHFDKSSGDCVSAHLFLKRQLKQETELGFMRWNIYEGGTHAILFGTNVDGSGFLIDFGGMREVVFTGGTGVFQFCSGYWESQC